LGPAEARRFLAALFPGGSVTKEITERLNILKEEVGLIEDDTRLSVVEQFIQDLLDLYARDPNSKSMASLK
jgi:intracellular multiplication protein IcmB